MQRLSSLEDESQILKGLIDEQTKALFQLREEKDQLMEENEALLKSQDLLNQKILTSIYDNLSDNVIEGNGSDEVCPSFTLKHSLNVSLFAISSCSGHANEKGKKYSQEEISNFCMYIATRFGLKSEPYKCEVPVLYTSVSKNTLTRSPKKERRTRVTNVMPSVSQDDLKKEDSKVDAVEKSRNDYSGRGGSKEILKKEGEKKRFKKNLAHSIDHHHSHASGAHTVSERRSSSKSSKNTTADEIFDNSGSKRKQREALNNDKTTNNNNNNNHNETKGNDQQSKHDHKHDSKHDHRQEMKTSGTRKDKQEKDIKEEDKGSSKPQPENSNSENNSELFTYYFDNVKVVAFPFQPNSSIQKTVHKICHQKNVNYENIIFKDVKGQVIELQSTTLQKDIPDRQLIFTFLDGKPGLGNSAVLTSMNSQSPSPRKKITKNHSLDAAAIRDREKMFGASRESTHRKSKTGDLPMLQGETKAESVPSPKKNDSPPKIAPSNKAIRTQIDINEIREKTTSAWSIQPKDSPLFGDLCRLAPRISFYDSRSSSDRVEYIPEEGLTPIQYAKTLITRVVKALESKEEYEKLSPLLNEADKALDGGLWVRSVFQELGDNCKTAKFLMAIHQGILTPSANQIKVVLFSNTNQFTKDVQGKDGWRIELSLSDEQVQISHLRKEVSMIPDNIKLAATNLQMGANCNPIQKQKIQDCLDQFKS